MNFSLDAINLLGDMLTEQDNKDSINVEALDELWKLYDSLHNPDDVYPTDEISVEERNACDHYNERYVLHSSYD